MNDKEEPREEKSHDGDSGPRSDWNLQNGSLLRGVAVGLGIAFAVMTIFSLGVFVGQQKARFSIRWGQNYNQHFGEPRRMVPGGPRDFFGGHGTAGMVIKKTADSLVIRSRDNAEKIVLITDKTQIVERRQAIKLKDVAEDSMVVVIGSPDDKGRIKARLIRIFDGRMPLNGDVRRSGPRQGGIQWRDDTSRQSLSL